MTDALLQMSALADAHVTQSPHFLDMTKLFLISVMSTAADIAETTSEGSAPWLYAEMEAAAKHGGLETIRNTTATKIRLKDCLFTETPPNWLEIYI